VAHAARCARGMSQNDLSTLLISEELAKGTRRRGKIIRRFRTGRRVEILGDNAEVLVARKSVRCMFMYVRQSRLVPIATRLHLIDLRYELLSNLPKYKFSVTCQFRID
jgi:hypothetical protein